jgi:hypothetical protein
MSDTVLVAVITSLAVISAAWGGQWWSTRDRRLERKDAAIVSVSLERRADLRDLADTLVEVVASAKEIAWERVVSHRPLPRSDQRAMRLTMLGGRTKSLRVKIGDDSLDGLVRAVVRCSSKLSDTVVDDLGAPDLDRDMAAASRALDDALACIGALLRGSISNKRLP